MTETEFGKCQTCKYNEGVALHVCPFAKEVDMDDKTLCNCCNYCEDLCADEI